MIAKHIPINSVRKSNFATLVNYICDPQSKTERIGLVRAVNCYSDRPDCVIAEVLNTQQMNQRATSDKTYHLVVSFRDAVLADHVLQAVEDKLCEGLGFGEHQRMSAVHHDTDHLHIHIAINKIHPTRFTIHNPHYDYKVMGDLCKKLEEEYGLTPDNHDTQKRGAQGKEANIAFKAGSESLIGWMKQECLEQIHATVSWSALHQVLADHGLELKERGSGLVFVSNNGVGVKASSVDRALSKFNLVKKYGAYEAVDGNESTKTNEKNKHSKQYEKKPLPGKLDTTELYAQYRAEQHAAAVHGKNEWIRLRDKKDQAIDSVKKKAKLKRLLIKNVTAGKLARQLMYASVHQEARARIESIKKDYQQAYQASKAQHRKMDWLSWLVNAANRGNQAALAVLRSRKEDRRTEDYVSGAQGRTTDGSAKYPEMVETITRTGTIIFNMGSTAIREGGQGWMVKAGTAKDKILAILTAAIKKYGNQLTINGSDVFREQVVQVAAETALEVTFVDEALEQRRLAMVNRARGPGRSHREKMDAVKKASVLKPKTIKARNHPAGKGLSR